MSFCLPLCKEHKKHLQFFDFSPKMFDEQKKCFCMNCQNRPNNLITLGSLIDQVEKLKDDEIKIQKDQVKKNQDFIIDFKEKMEKIFRTFYRELKSFEEFPFQADQLHKQLDNITNTNNNEINIQNLYDIVSPKITINQDYVQINRYLTPKFQDYSDLFDSMTIIYQNHLKARDPIGKTINQTLKCSVISANQNSNTYTQSTKIQLQNNQQVNNQQVNNQSFKELQTVRMTTSNYLVQTQSQQNQIVQITTNIPIVQQQSPIKQQLNDPQLSNQTQQYQGNFSCVKHGRIFEKVSFGEQVALYCSNCIPQGETITFNEFHSFLQNIQERKYSSPSDIIINNFIEWYNGQKQIILEQIQQMQDRIIKSLNQYQIQSFQQHFETQFTLCFEQKDENGMLELFQIIKSFLYFDQNKIYHISQTLNGLKMFKKYSDLLKQRFSNLEQVIVSIE